HQQPARCLGRASIGARGGQLSLERQPVRLGGYDHHTIPGLNAPGKVSANTCGQLPVTVIELDHVAACAYGQLTTPSRHTTPTPLPEPPIVTTHPVQAKRQTDLGLPTAADGTLATFMDAPGPSR